MLNLFLLRHLKYICSLANVDKDIFKQLLLLFQNNFCTAVKAKYIVKACESLRTLGQFFSYYTYIN